MPLVRERKEKRDNGKKTSNGSDFKGMRCFREVNRGSFSYTDVIIFSVENTVISICTIWNGEFKVELQIRNLLLGVEQLVLREKRVENRDNLHKN